MAIDVGREVGAIKRMTAGAMRDRHAEGLGEATTTASKTWQVCRIARRLHVLAEGPLGDSATTC